jgi:hypothetical protein
MRLAAGHAAAEIRVGCGDNVCSAMSAESRPHLLQVRHIGADRDISSAQPQPGPQRTRPADQSSNAASSSGPGNEPRKSRTTARHNMGPSRLHRSSRISTGDERPSGNPKGLQRTDPGRPDKEPLVQGLTRGAEGDLREPWGYWRMRWSGCRVQTAQVLACARVRSVSARKATRTGWMLPAAKSPTRICFPALIT